MNRPMNLLLRKTPSSEKGATVVEFALIVPLLLILLMGVIELGALF